MRKTFACGDCAASVDVNEYVRSRFDKPTQQRCPRCGCAHNFLRGEFDVVSPPMMPCDAPGRVSPWMLAEWRPARAGWYEVRFYDVEPILFLWWNGRSFQPSQHDARIVDTRSLFSWRGTWGDA